MSKPQVIKGGNESLEPFSHALTVLPDAPPERRESDRKRAKSDEAFSKAFAHGHDEGYAAGLEQGIHEAKAAAFEQANELHEVELAQFREALQRKLDEIDAAMVAWFASTEDTITEAVVEIAQRVLQAELKQDRSSVLAIVKKSLRDLGAAKVARIRLNPFDTPTLEDAKDELTAIASDLERIEFIDDPSISGGCRIETEGVSVDATVETQLASVTTALEEAA